ASSGKMPHVPLCSPPAGLAPPGFETVREPATALLVQANAPESPPASPPAWCDRQAGDAATASSTSDSGFYRMQYKPAAREPGAGRCGIAADRSARTTARP